MSTDAPAQVCPTCGAGMAAGQDWCLECGSAAPGRLGARPGWRAVGTITGLTAVLVAGAAAAGYAAITDPAPDGGSGTPVAQVPASTTTTPAVPGPVDTTQTAPPTTVPGTTETTPTIPTPSPEENRPTRTAPTTPTTTPTPSRSPAPAPSPTPTPGPTQTTPTPDPAFDLDKDSVSTYDPYGRPGAEIGKPRWAVDGKQDTVWDVVVPADGLPIGVGLLVDLGSPQAVSSLELETRTEGFKVEVYAAKARHTPSTITSDAWQHVTDVAAVKEQQTIPLGAVKGRVRRILLWITTPARPEDPRAAISELTIRKG